MVTTITLIGGFAVFDFIFVMTGGGPAGASEVLGTYAYSSAFQLNRISYGTTLALVITVMAVPFAVLHEPAAAPTVDAGDGCMSEQQLQRQGSPHRGASASKHVVLTILSLLMLFPLVLTISTATEDQRDVTVNPFGLFSSFSTENIVDAWTVGRLQRLRAEQLPAVGAEHAACGRAVDDGRLCVRPACPSSAGRFCSTSYSPACWCRSSPT
jgi:hypothetical protein